MTKHHAVPTFGVTPRKCSFAVADHVTRSAFEALFVIEQNAAIVGGHKQFCRARNHARFGRATAADIGVDNDVRFVRHAKINGLHPIVEAERS